MRTPGRREASPPPSHARGAGRGHSLFLGLKDPDDSLPPGLSGLLRGPEAPLTAHVGGRGTNHPRSKELCFYRKDRPIGNHYLNQIMLKYSNLPTPSGHKETSKTTNPQKWEHTRP